ncbi:HupE/UreJ family protein [Alteromonas sp. H39]|uniref:HupE/UreJ family protein n=1 Tax=Alteromonas sp. H39 TaxID=3389876 RepID=UPI0039DFFE2D
MRNPVSRFFSLILLIGAAWQAQSHEISSGYLTIASQKDSNISGELSVKPYDLAHVVNVDSDADGQLTWGEVMFAQEAIGDYLQSHLSFSRNNDACTLTSGSPTLSVISGENLITVPFSATCPPGESLSVSYRGIFDFDPTHKVLTTFTANEIATSVVLTQSSPSYKFDSRNTGFWDGVLSFVYEGIIHIWIGIDHILFLLALLLTVNLIRRQASWVGRPTITPILKETIYLVTAFTVAHSITLTITALGWIAPSSRWVEVGIAVSVLLTAMNNIWPVVTRLTWITFAFGLLHGMGFASVFAELQSNSNSTLVTVASFNIGVEIGQLVIVLAVLPLLIVVRKWRWYPRAMMPLASSAIAIVALNWAIQRL